MHYLTAKDFGLPDGIFPFVNGPLQYEGRETTNPLAFRHYNPDDAEMNGMLRFAMAYWHTMCGQLADMFGEGTAVRPWGSPATLEEAKFRARAAYYIAYLLRLKWICFHDTDLVPYGKNLAEFEANLKEIVKLMKELGAMSGIGIGWATQNLFSAKFYAKGAASTTSPIVFAHACAQAKLSLEAGLELGAKNHVCWGGREGYNDLLVTKLGFEQDNLARFLQMLVDYKKQIGSDARLLIEPKPMEPTRYQYDASTAVVIAFLRKYGLLDHFAMNIETNHAQLAGLTVEHELELAGSQGLLGGIDANQGTPGNGWDTDEFPTDINLATRMMIPVLRWGGVGCGVINFDAKPRREDFTVQDIFESHRVGMDTMAHGYKAALWLACSGKLEDIVKARYAGWDGELGIQILSQVMTLAEVAAFAYGRQPDMETDLGSSRMARANDLINVAIAEAA